MRTKLLAIFLLIILPLLMLSCEENARVKTQEYYDLFNTVSTVQSYLGDTDEEFDENCDTVYTTLSEYHKLFDIYYEYAGINNLATVNRLAGRESVEVSPLLIDFLLYAKDIYSLTDGKTNIAIGAVTKLWHGEREAAEDGGEGKLPDSKLLAEAARHTSIDDVIIDKASCTVFLRDPEMSLDVGAIGKGYAAEMAKRELEQLGISSYVLNIGGNICAIGEKPSGEGWRTSVRNPHGNGYVASVVISNTSCVTSGDYERYYTVEGVRYHHIIDPETLYPAEYFSSVTVFTENSALADALSTALFCMPYSEGEKLISSLDGVEVLWITPSGEQFMTEGVSKLKSE
ncbi:MAG: FAD:protein FMN transferase [Clostridia bacterium]|nr:FAD:protein FMN transferase [Clostridia bacterium]